ncbi:MAG: hypothetical protein R3F11_22720 [Verrucomicrobiales bacterium]
MLSTAPISAEITTSELNPETAAIGVIQIVPEEFATPPDTDTSFGPVTDSAGYCVLNAAVSAASVPECLAKIDDGTLAEIYA